MTDAVFRFFAGADDCAAYLSRRWRGRGLHGDVALPPEWTAACELALAGPEAVRADVAYLKPKRSWLARLRAWRRETRAQKRKKAPPPASGSRRSPAFSLGESSAEYAPDFARWGAGGWQLTVQALDERRLHCVLAEGGAIRFAGVLERS